ncbi:hypothetical protein M9458_001597, partial [Cirrhinus mrigala]
DLTNLKQCLTELGYTNLLPQTQPESLVLFTEIQCVFPPKPTTPAVLSLNVKEGENVLDLCAAPGGKSLAILQTTTPG